MPGASRFFSTDYYQSRAQFRRTVGAAAWEAGSAVAAHAAGPRVGDDISMDWAIAGPEKAPRGLVLISGTHGVEGYAGAAAIQGFFTEGLAREATRAGLRTLVIHAHNPWGYAWDTRFNEDNVDLNRNYIDWSHETVPENHGYAVLSDAIAPANRDPEAMNAADARLMAYAGEFGFPALQAAITAGQGEFPKGLYYSGTGPSWSKRTLSEVTRAAMLGVRDVVWIDFHTGLGPYGHGEVITEAPAGSEAFERVQRVWEGEAQSTVEGASVSAHLEGTIESAANRLVPGATNTFCALEFGTIDSMSVFRATRDSSWLHMYGNPANAAAEPIRRAIRDAFYPDKDDWKAMVWERSRWAIERAMTAPLR
jgi:hypothetical protein